MMSKDTYDVVIIGAGLSGLVCGCRLAKAGMKVLIAEQHSRPGGYCTSFKRGDFTFDAAAHSLGGYTSGILGKIFRDIGVDRKISMMRHDPSNTIITPEFTISFWSDMGKTVEGIRTAFPEEKANVAPFFDAVLSPDSRRSAGLRNSTFQEFLDQHFHDPRLKTILSFPLYGNGGLPPSLMSAFVGMSIFKEYLLDGGYHLEGGIQVLSDALADRFRELGGELRLRCRIEKIKLKDNTVVGIIPKDQEFIPSRYVVSNGDARQTFGNLIGKRYLPKDFLSRLKAMNPSLSMFIVYLGLDGKLSTPVDSLSNLWYLYDYDLDRAYREARKGNFRWIGGYLVQLSSDRKTIVAFMLAPFKSGRFWQSNKTRLTELFAGRIEKDLFPGLGRHITFRDAATPHTLHRYTSNYQGAAFGWECTPSQLVISDFGRPSFIKRLYLTGHWTTKGLGTPGVTYVGYDTAGAILRREATGMAGSIS